MAEDLYCISWYEGGFRREVYFETLSAERAAARVMLSRGIELTRSEHRSGITLRHMRLLARWGRAPWNRAYLATDGDRVSFVKSLSIGKIVVVEKLSEEEKE